MLTPYQFASNRPIDGVDLDGLEYIRFSVNHHSDLPAPRLEFEGIQLRHDTFWDGIIFRGWREYSGDLITESKIRFWDLYGGEKFFDTVGEMMYYFHNQYEDDLKKDKVEIAMLSTMVGLQYGQLSYNIGTPVVVGSATSDTGVSFSDFIYFRLGKLRSSARKIEKGQGIPLKSGKQSLRIGSGEKFSNVKQGAYGDASNKYIWTIDNKGINIGLEQTRIGSNSVIKHTNLSRTAYSGGEVWFTGKNTVHINAWSGRFGAGAKISKQQWKASQDAWKSLGYEVVVEPYVP